MTLDNLLLVLAGLLPGAVLLSVLAWRGRPVRFLAFCLFVGALACAPALLLERLLTLQPWNMGNFGVFLAFALIVAGLVEEGCKLGAWYVGPARWRDAHTDEYDSILYAACVSLGFATTENVFYCLSTGWNTALVRAFTAVPAHTLFGVLMGSWLGIARLRARVGWSTGHLVASGLLAAVIAHGLYDVLAFQGSRPALVLLGVGLAAGAGWGAWRIALARRRSPAYGGVAPIVPPPLAPIPARVFPPADRDPVHALLLGLVPGLGQWYNGQRSKALLFAALALFNGALYGVARLFAEDPARALDWMNWAGLTIVGLRPADFQAAVEQSMHLPLVFLSALLIGVLLGALDAWWEAQGGRRRESYASQGVVLSYITHVLLALLLTFAPVLARKMEEKVKQEQAAAARAQGKPPAEAQRAEQVTMELTRVEKLDGWTPPGRTAKAPAPRGERPVAAAAPRPVPTPVPQAPRPVPTPRAAAPKPSPASPRVVYGRDRRPAPAPSPRPSSRAPAGRQPVVDVAVPTVTSGPSVRRRPDGDPTPLRTPQGPENGDDVAVGPSSDGDAPLGQDGWYSYNQYLSYRFHEGHEADYFFRFVPKEVWVVVHYEIDADGTLLSAEVLETSGRPAQAERVTQMLRNCAPYRPLPRGIRRISVTELFWAREFTDFPPGSIAQSLSHLPDGRSIRE